MVEIVELDGPPSARGVGLLEPVGLEPDHSLLALHKLGRLPNGRQAWQRNCCNGAGLLQIYWVAPPLLADPLVQWQVVLRCLIFL